MQPLTPAARLPPRARRARDPAKMAPRDRRNLLPEEDLLLESEFLVFGSFREDHADEGFKATVWLPTSDLTPLKAEFDEALDALESLLRGMRENIEYDAATAPSAASSPAR